jgi:hypothetical protein
MRAEKLLSVSFVLTDLSSIQDADKMLLDNVRSEFEHSIYQNIYIDKILQITRRGLFIIDDRLDAGCTVSVEFLADIIDYMPGEVVLAAVTAIDDTNLFAKGYNFIINITIPTVVKNGTNTPAIQFTVGNTYPFMVKNIRAVNGRKEINISGHVVMAAAVLPPTRVMTAPTLTFEIQNEIVRNILANKPPAWDFFSKLFGDTVFGDISIDVDTVVYMPARVCAAPVIYTGNDAPIEDTGDNIMRDIVNRRMIYCLNLQTLGVLTPDQIMAMKPALSFIAPAKK